MGPCRVQRAELTHLRCYDTLLFLEPSTSRQLSAHDCVRGGLMETRAAGQRTS